MIIRLFHIIVLYACVSYTHSKFKNNVTWFPVELTSPVVIRLSQRIMFAVKRRGKYPHHMKFIRVLDAQSKSSESGTIYKVALEAAATTCLKQRRFSIKSCPLLECARHQVCVGENWPQIGDNTFDALRTVCMPQSDPPC